MGDTVETLKQFAIKALSARVIDEITETARTSVPKVTVGQLVERVWDHWKQDGQPAVVAPDAADARHDPRSDDLDKIERAVRAAVMLADSDVPETFRKRANRRLLAALPSPMKPPSVKVTVQAPVGLEGPLQKA